MKSKLGCAFDGALLVGLLLSVLMISHLYRQLQEVNQKSPQREQLHYLREVAERMGLEVGANMQECDIMASICILINEARRVPTNAISSKTVEGISRMMPKEDLKTFRKMLEFTEEVRGRRVVILPGERK